MITFTRPHIILLLLLLATGFSRASVQMQGLPGSLDSSYDLTWELRGAAVATAPMQVDIEAYRLVIDGAMVRLERAGVGTVTQARLALTPGQRSAFTFKRRPGTCALLLEHRLLFTAPCVGEGRGRVTFRDSGGAPVVSQACYHKISACLFADDFMRPGAVQRVTGLLSGHGNTWVDDEIWRVASAPPQPCNPWQLSLYPQPETTANGFWFLYTGVGPSWVVANDTCVSPRSDAYFVQAAVRPDFDSAVGLLAAYQDNGNYLLLRWQPARVELVAMVDGTPRVLAARARGFAPQQWYTLRLNLSWRRVQASIDGVTLFDVANPGPVEGRVGLYADGPRQVARPALDPLTATMYRVTDPRSGRVMNDAADALRPTPYLLFDDVRMGDWQTIDDLSASPYRVTRTGRWTRAADGTLTAQRAGVWVSEHAPAQRYAFSGEVRLPGKGTAGLLLQDEHGDGYLWTLTRNGCQLRRVSSSKFQVSSFKFQVSSFPLALSCVMRRPGQGDLLDRSHSGWAPGAWASVRMEVDGHYLSCYCAGQRVLEWYADRLPDLRCGLCAATASVSFRQCALTPLPQRFSTVKIHPGFDTDRWISTWASSEADWYPATLLTARPPVADTGTVGASPTNVPGLYWYKGGLYGDLRITLPLLGTRRGQVIYLTSRNQTAAGYRFAIVHGRGGLRVQLWRQGTRLGDAALLAASRARLVLERCGAWLALRQQVLDPAPCLGEPEILRDRCLLLFRDRHPLPADQLGVQVTDRALPAVALQVQSARIQDTFEDAPVGWVARSGIWKVMARYSCQPKWNWFGGFGAGTPAVWSKARLGGDQNVEVYLGVKMAYENMPADEEGRFRDLNLSICADGVHATSGYSVIRAGVINGVKTTALLRNGVMVQRTTVPAYLLPNAADGHREWFATRIEKHGARIEVYLDNRPALVYTDPHPLPGGYVAVWTQDNGIMLGRANYSAERMEGVGG
jgi:hypothetical protein